MRQIGRERAANRDSVVKTQVADRGVEHVLEEKTSEGLGWAWLGTEQQVHHVTKRM